MKERGTIWKTVQFTVTNMVLKTIVKVYAMYDLYTEITGRGRIWCTRTQIYICIRCHPSYLDFCAPKFNLYTEQKYTFCKKVSSLATFRLQWRPNSLQIKTEAYLFLKYFEFQI
jgi:hypothetical protein